VFDTVMNGAVGVVLAFAPIPFHIGQGTTIAVLPWTLAGALVGLLAAIAVLFVRRSVALGPARAVAATLRRSTPEDVSDTGVVVVHCISGTLTGVVYALTAADIAYLLPEFPKINDISVYPHVLAIALTVVALAVVFDTVFLLQDSGTEETMGTLRHRWGLTLAIYAVALSVLAPLFLRLYTLVSG
jgi:hypothetical protein